MKFAGGPLVDGRETDPKQARPTQLFCLQQPKFADAPRTAGSYRVLGWLRPWVTYLIRLRTLTRDRRHAGRHPGSVTPAAAPAARRSDADG
jgi:hypothetical protein